MKNRFLSIQLPEDRPVEQRNALRIALFGFLASTISASFYLYLGIRSGDWQLYAWGADIFALAAAVVVGGALIRRGRISTGMWLIIWAAVISFVGTVLLIEGTGLVIGVGLGVLVAVIAGQTLSSDSAARAVRIGVTGAIASILLDQFLPPYRLPQPEATRTFLPGIIAAVILILGYVILRQFRDYSLRTKLLISMSVITALSLGAYGFFTSRRSAQSQAFLSDELQATVQEQAEQELTSAAAREADVAEDLLAQIPRSLQQLADYRAALYGQSEMLGAGQYWSSDSLAQFEGGQYGNSTSDIASAFLPAGIPLTESSKAEFNLSAYLDFVAPSFLDAHPNVVAVYYMLREGGITYYPNIDFVNVVPPDFDPRQGLYYTVATPENNPERKPVWTPPYEDPAGMGMLVTSAIPVYDQRGNFRGVISADIQLTRVTEQVANIQAGESGFAFLVDSAGRVIAMTDAGYAFFDLEPEIVPVDEIPKQTVLGLGSAELQDITQKMTQGGDGLARVTVEDVEYYLAYAPLESVGYSIGLVAPVAELEAKYLAANERVEAENKNTEQLTTLILIGVLLGAALLSQFISQALSSPLLQLRAAADQVTQGNLNARAPITSKDEIGALGETFNIMTAQLSELIGSLEQRVAERTRALSTVAEVGTSASTILETDKLLQEVVDLTKERFGFYHAHIYLLDGTGDHLVLAAGAGEPGLKMVAEGRSIPLDSEQSLVARAAREQKGVTVNDVTRASDFLPNPYLPDTRSELAAPMVVGDQVVGVFDVQSDLVGRFTNADVDIQTTLASQIAVAIQNARQYELANRFQQQYTLALEGSNDGIWDWDIANNSIFYSARWKAMLGYEEYELTRGFVEWEERIHPEDRDYAVKALDDYLEGRAPEYDVRIRLRHKDGTWRWIRDRGKALRRPDGTAYRMAGSHSDITEAVLQQELATQRARQQEALNRITQNIQSASTVEAALQVAARELGHALGSKPTLVEIEPGVMDKAA
jgi:PAS domain S-box-containing protein